MGSYRSRSWLIDLLWFFIHQIETFMLNYGSLIPFIRGLHTTSNGENYGLIS